MDLDNAVDPTNFIDLESLHLKIECQFTKTDGPDVDSHATIVADRNTMICDQLALIFLL